MLRVPSSNYMGSILESLPRCPIKPATSSSKTSTLFFSIAKLVFLKVGMTGLDGSSGTSSCPDIFCCSNKSLQRTDAYIRQIYEFSNLAFQNGGVGLEFFTLNAALGQKEDD